MMPRVPLFGFATPRSGMALSVATRVMTAIALLSVAAPAVNAQLSNSPPASECVRRTADGHCTLWQPEFLDLLRHPDIYRGLRVRLEGYVILK